MLLDVAEPFSRFINSFELTTSNKDIYIYSISDKYDFTESFGVFGSYEHFMMTVDTEDIDRAFMVAVRHAHDNGFGKIIILKDGVEFCMTANDTWSLYGLLDSYDILHLNPNECNDCYLLNKKAIDYIATYKVDISSKSWKLIIENRIKKRLSVGAVKIDILKHTSISNMETYASSIIQTTQTSNTQTYADYNNIKLPSQNNVSDPQENASEETYLSMFNMGKAQECPQVRYLSDTELKNRTKNLTRSLKYTTYDQYLQKYMIYRNKLNNGMYHIEYPNSFVNTRCVIIIPVYKQRDLKDYEIDSIRQTVAVFGSHYNICLLCPDCIDISIYRDITDNYNFSVLRADLAWFLNMYSYSRICEESAFYKIFADYEYMLICQTDAWVTKDRIEEFISYGYDYYGARCFMRRNTHYNGGFSLRNVKKMIEIAKTNKNHRLVPEDLYYSSKVNGDLKVCRDNMICDKFAVQSSFNFDKNRDVFGYHYIHSLPNFRNDIIEKTRIELTVSLDVKVAVCAIAKLENHYIREWVEYYKNLGVDNIILYDNNDRNGEVFADVISDYINDGFVILKDVRGKTCYQLKAYQSCWDEYSSDYDWIAFFDCDEFLTLRKDCDIKHYLSRDVFKSIDSISINWLSYDDNGLTGFEDITNYNVLDRFKEPKKDNDVLPKDFGKRITEYKYNNRCFKRIVRCGKPIKIMHCHIVSEDLKINKDNTGKIFSVWGSKGIQEKSFSKEINYDYAYLKHYPTKTVREYINTKFARRSALSVTDDKMYKNIFYGFNKNHTKITDLLFDKNAVKILIVNYNTQNLTDACIKSINKHMKNVLVYVFDNSDKEKFVNSYDNVIVLDNTEGQIIDFVKMRKYWRTFGKAEESTGNMGSACHTYTIDVCMDLLGSDFILLDSDVVVKKDLTPLVDKNVVFTAEVGVRLRGWDERVFPFCCYINVPLCRKYGIRYFNKNHMHGINIDRRNMCDTGGYFWMAAKNHKYNKIKCFDYVNHMGSGSHTYKGNITAEMFIERNKFYWQ